MSYFPNFLLLLMEVFINMVNFRALLLKFFILSLGLFLYYTCGGSGVNSTEHRRMESMKTKK